MSLLTNTGRYASAGANLSDGVRFGVRDEVRAPDGEAGTPFAQGYRAAVGSGKKVRVHAARISMKSAAVILALCLICCLSGILARASQCTELRRQIDSVAAAIEATRTENESLKKQVEAVRDVSRIGYIAVNELGMVAGSDENTVRIAVPETEVRSAGNMPSASAALSASGN